MEGIRFYEEFKDKGKGESAGVVCAILVDNYRIIDSYRGNKRHSRRYEKFWDGVAGLFSDTPNSHVASTGISDIYLKEECKRISEKKARVIHPRLFEYLDNS